jgi:hypothetical protein
LSGPYPRIGRSLTISSPSSNSANRATTEGSRRASSSSLSAIARFSRLAETRAPRGLKRTTAASTPTADAVPSNVVTRARRLGLERHTKNSKTTLPAPKPVKADREPVTAEPRTNTTEYKSNAARTVMCSQLISKAHAAATRAKTVQYCASTVAFPSVENGRAVLLLVHSNGSLPAHCTTS